MRTQLLIGGRFYSSSSPDATAMAITDGTVVWLGAEQPGRALHPDAEIVDLDGAFVAPAFVEPHVHVTAYGLRLTGLDLSTVGSLAECLRLIGEYAAAHPEATVLGSGWDETRWPERRAPSGARRPPPPRAGGGGGM
uniref:amidohydrolase family protein n=1 Tax=Nocardia farcinica TaxID=37329 RepID=UPI00245496BE